MTRFEIASQERLAMTGAHWVIARRVSQRRSNLKAWSEGDCFARDARNDWVCCCHCEECPERSRRVSDEACLPEARRQAISHRIDLLHRIHYLQWTGVRTLDKVLGLAGILLVIALSVLGVRIAFKVSSLGRDTWQNPVH
jgi:hypothetical protein